MGARPADSPSFNGAALVGVRRGQAGRRACNATDGASTEPHSLECGERRRRCCRRSGRWLQRSRTRWSAESLRLPRIPRPRPLASTEPHSLECGECPPLSSDSDPARTLQRSRTRWSAESTAGRIAAAIVACRFNGAALVGVRRAPTPASPPAPPACFNGAALVGVRRAASAACAPPAPNRFNGAALVGVRREGSHDPQASTLGALQRSRTRWSAESVAFGRLYLFAFSVEIASGGSFEHFCWIEDGAI